jgi:hypothetical protein
LESFESLVEDGRNSDVESISGSESEEEEGTGAAKVSKEHSPIEESLERASSTTVYFLF